MKPWNGLNAVPFNQWLQMEHTTLDRQRLFCLGNIAVPACAALAAEINCHMLQK